MERLAAETVADSVWGGEAIVLRDGNSWARLRPDQGANLVGFGAVVQGREVETMLQPADESPARGPDQYGAPVLFPFPNRLREGRASFGGRDIRIDLPAGRPWAIHGLVRTAAWRIEDVGVAGDEAIARFSIESSPEVLRQFPFPYYHALTYRLRGPILRIDVEARNVGDAPLPIGFGWHPYFGLPLVAGGTREANVVGVPARRQWQLDGNLLPTGEVLAVPPERDFQQPHTLGGTHLDDVYTDVIARDGESVCTLADPSSGVTLAVAAGPTFREWVVYAPPTRPTICFEPYTCPTDALNLQARGRDAGLIVLAPGETWRDWMELRLFRGPAAPGS